LSPANPATYTMKAPIIGPKIRNDRSCNLVTSS